MITMYFLLFLILKTAIFFSLYTNKNHGRNGLTTYGRELAAWQKTNWPKLKVREKFKK